VIAAASTDAKLDVCRKHGADALINYDREDLKERVRALTDGRGADVVYDPVGGSYTAAASRSVAWNGRYLVIGFAAGEIPQIPLNLPLLKGYSIVGVYWGGFVQREPAGNAANMKQLDGLDRRRQARAAHLRSLPAVAGRRRPFCDDATRSHGQDRHRSLSLRREAGRSVVAIPRTFVTATSNSRRRPELPRRSRNPTRCSRETRRFPEVVDRAPARGGCIRKHALVEPGDVLARSPRELGVDPSGQHRIDLDVVRAQATASDLVSCTTPPLLAPYTGAKEAPKIDSIDPTLMILPRPATRQMAVGAARAQERAREVGVEHRPPLVEARARVRASGC
jgi:hypothetical protein